MAYIGNGRTLLIVGTNVRDDLVPAYNDVTKSWPEDGAFDKTTFELSQEVPGGYEENVLVLRQEYKKDVLVSNTTLLSIQLVSATQIKLVCNNSSLAAALSAVEEPAEGFDDTQTLTISGSSNSNNNQKFVIQDVVYNGSIIEIFLKKLGSETASTGESLSVVYGRLGYWEVLEAVKDYTISGIGTRYNRLINLSKAPQMEDKVYVLHKGDATYNFVPSPNSVGPDQLSHNLRNFSCDRYVGDGVSTTFVLSFTGSDKVVNSKALLVSIDGVILEGDDPDGAISGDWKLDTELTGSGQQTITFTTSPATNSKIRILHLGFSTVSRRQTISPGQVGAIADGTITESKIANGAVTSSKIFANSVTTSKIANNQITGEKMLLGSGESIRWNTTAGIVNILNTGANGNVTLQSPNGLVGIKSVNNSVYFTETSIFDGSGTNTEGVVSLGRSQNKFKDLHLSGVSNSTGLSVIGLNSTPAPTDSPVASIVGNVSITGNISLTGNIDGADVSDIRNELTQLNLKLNALIPVGSIMLSARSEVVDPQWMTCDGAAVNTYTYRELHSKISSLYGGTAYQAGVTDQVGAATTFNLPDLRRRFPIGKSSTDTIGNNEGISNPSLRTIKHTHTGASHTHTFDHTHTIPGHSHNIQAGNTLAIGASGTHTTEIGHNHGVFTTGGPNTDLSHTHNVTHDHGTLGTGWNDRDHSHDFSGTTGGSSQPNRRFGAASGNYGVAAFDSGATGWSHTHGFSGTTGGQNTGHVHYVTIPSITNTTGGPNTAGNSLSHTHNVTITAFTGNSTSTGSHTHSAANFSGNIGNTAVNGDNTITSSASSVNTTSAATYSGVSGESVSPYIVLNYMIKVL